MLRAAEPALPFWLRSCSFTAAVAATAPCCSCLLGCRPALKAYPSAPGHQPLPLLGTLHSDKAEVSHGPRGASDMALAQCAGHVWVCANWHVLAVPCGVGWAHASADHARGQGVCEVGPCVWGGGGMRDGAKWHECERRRVEVGGVMCWAPIKVGGHVRVGAMHGWGP